MLVARHPMLRLAVGFSFATLVLAAAAQTAPVAAQAGTAKIVKGQVTVTVTGAQGARALAPGDAVSAADRLVTGPDSSASMVLRDGTMMVVGASSQMELSKFNYDSTTQNGSMAVSLLRGTMRMITGLMGKSDPTSVAVTTPTSTIGIRGTDFIVEVDETSLVQ